MEMLFDFLIELKKYQQHVCSHARMHAYTCACMRHCERQTYRDMVRDRQTYSER